MIFRMWTSSSTTRIFGIGFLVVDPRGKGRGRRRERLGQRGELLQAEGLSPAVPGDPGGGEGRGQPSRERPQDGGGRESVAEHLPPLPEPRPDQGEEEGRPGEKVQADEDRVDRRDRFEGLPRGRRHHDRLGAVATVEGERPVLPSTRRRRQAGPYPPPAPPEAHVP